jgi:hypothetical protein
LKKHTHFRDATHFSKAGGFGFSLKIYEYCDPATKTKKCVASLFIGQTFHSWVFRRNQRHCKFQIENFRFEILNALGTFLAATVSRT